MLILHLLNLAADPENTPSNLPDVPARTVENAGIILEYLKSHTRRVYAVMRAKARGEEGNDEVQAILKWIFRHRPESFSQRDLTRNLTRTIGKRPQALYEALNWLIGHRCIRPVATDQQTNGRAGRKSSPVYEVNPYLLESRNCQNHESSGAGSHTSPRSVDNGDSAESGGLLSRGGGR